MKREKLPRDLIIRPENMAKGTVYTNRNIIAGYHNTGKTEAASRQPKYFLDLDHTIYKYHLDNKGIISVVDNWQENYIADLLKIAYSRITDTDPWIYVLICTDPEVLKALEKENIYYMAVVPDSIETLRSRHKDYIDRSKITREIMEFLEYKDATENYARHMEEIKTSSALGIYNTDRFIFDIFT